MQSLPPTRRDDPATVSTLAPSPDPNRRLLAPLHAEPSPPTRPIFIARFLVIDELGAGAMGRVYAAYDPELDRRVALKLLHDADADAAARLHREAQAMARLSHPNVVTVYEVGNHAEQLFIAMELVAGETLARWLSAAPRPWPAVLAAFRAAGEGLAAAHDAGLVHRDFKPANVLVGADGRVRVADFGLVYARVRPIAASHEPADPPMLTRAGTVLGTPAYMAPEQILGAPTDARTDVFAFCLALWEARFGARPFTGETIEELHRSIARGAPDDPPKDSLRDRWLRPLLRRGLEVDPERRWPDMRSLLDALAHDPAIERARRRRGALRGLAALALGVVLVFGGAALWSAVQARAREASARAQLDAVLARVELLRAEGRDEEAVLVLDGFVAAPEHAGTRALVEALRWRAEDRRGRGDVDGAIDAYARAYAAADGDEVAGPLLGLAGLFRQRQAWASLTWALASLEASPLPLPAAAAAMRRDAALYRRDFAAAARHAPSQAALFAALAQAEASEHRAQRAETIDLEGDGVASVVLWESLAGESDVTVARVAPGLPTVVDLTPRVSGVALHHVVPRTAPDPGRIIGAQRRMLVWDGHDFVVEAAWDAVLALTTASADLDADDIREVYVGIGRRGRRLLGLRPTAGGWQPYAPAPALDAADSDVQVLVAGDLDGDGRDELVAALGPPLAHDLRVLRAGAPGGPLVQVVRRRHGVVTDLQRVLTPDGPLLAVASAAAAADRATGADDTPPGLHVYRLTGGALDEVASYPVEPGARLRRVVVADLDGDGRPELVGEVQQEVHPGARRLEIFRPEAEGGRLQVGEVIPLVAVDRDDDPADELMVADARDRDRVWTLGTGSSALPALDLGQPQLAAPPPRDVADDPVLRVQWVRAEELAGLGLLAIASLRHAELARALPRGTARAAALARAAELADHAGEDDRAAALFEAAAVDDRAWFARATACHERLGRLDDAVRTLRALESDDPEVARTLARHQQLLRSERTLRFDRPVEPVWQILDPLVVRRDPRRGALVVDLLSSEPVLQLPVEIAGDFMVRVELTLAEIGLGGSFGFVLASQTDAWPDLVVVATATGATADPDARLTIGYRLEEQAADLPLPGPDSTLTIELSHLESRGEQRLTVLADGVPRGAVRRPVPRGLVGPAHLQLRRALKPSGIDAPWSRVELRRVTTRGLTIAAATPDPSAPARLALVEGDGEAALAALDADPTPPPGSAAWRALALFTASRDAEAVALLRVSLDLRAPQAPAYLAATRLLRARPGLAPLLREALGPGYLQLFWATWSPLAARDVRRPTVARALVEEAPRLDLVAAADTPGLAQPDDAVLLLRAVRTAAFVGQHQLVRARRELAGLDVRRASQSRHGRGVLAASLAAMAAQELADGDIDAAFARLDALAQVSAPEIFADLVATQPELAPLRADPRWPRPGEPRPAP